MAIGRTFEEAILKGLRSLEIGIRGLDAVKIENSDIYEELVNATDRRVLIIAEALRRGWPIKMISNLSKWDEFYITKIKNIIDMEIRIKEGLNMSVLIDAKRMGFSDDSISDICGCTQFDIRNLRKRCGIIPVYKMVDTCAAEFAAQTPYFYSTYEDKTDVLLGNERKKVIIIGGGPIRIGQGIEFDYCCVHGAMALQEEGIYAIIINNNPETVSTDYDISDRLYFEPLALEDVLNIIESEDADGVIVQYGGQTSVNLAVDL